MKIIITAKHKSTNEETIIANCFDREWAILLQNSLSYTMGNMYEFAIQDIINEAEGKNEVCLTEKYGDFI